MNNLPTRDKNEGKKKGKRSHNATRGTHRVRPYFFPFHKQMYPYNAPHPRHGRLSLPSSQVGSGLGRWLLWDAKCSKKNQKYPGSASNKAEYVSPFPSTHYIQTSRCETYRPLPLPSFRVPQTNLNTHFVSSSKDFELCEPLSLCGASVTQKRYLGLHLSQ